MNSLGKQNLPGVVSRTRENYVGPCSIYPVIMKIESRRVACLLICGLLLAAVCVSCVSSNSQTDQAFFSGDLPEETQALSDQKMERIIARLDDVEFPVEMERVCEAIGLPVDYIHGRYSATNAPPYLQTRSYHFHAHYELEFDTLINETNVSREFLIYDMRIWKKDEPKP